MQKATGSRFDQTLVDVERLAAYCDRCPVAA
jgi:hypothetical protein